MICPTQGSRTEADSIMVTSSRMTRRPARSADNLISQIYLVSRSIAECIRLGENALHHHDDPDRIPFGLRNAAATYSDQIRERLPDPATLGQIQSARLRERNLASNMPRSPSQPTALRRQSIAGSSSSPMTPTLARTRMTKKGRIDFAATNSATTEGAMRRRSDSPSATWRTPNAATPGIDAH